MSEDTAVQEHDAATTEDVGNGGEPGASMRTRLLRWRPSRFVAVVLALALAASVAGGVWWSRQGLPEDTALIVGQHVVPTDELRGRLATVKALYGVEAPTETARLDEFRRDAAQSVAVGFVVEDAAAARGVSIPDEEVDAALAQYVTSFFGEGEAGRETFVEALGTAGASQSDVRAEVARQLLVSRLFADVTADVPVPTDEEVSVGFEERRCGLRVPLKRFLRNIVVPTRQEAARVVQQVRTGTPFFGLVAATTIDQSTREQGGALGFLSRTDLEPAYARAAFGAPVGGVFGPVRTQYGWNVGLVVRETPAREAELADVSDSLRVSLLDEERSAAWRVWLREQLEKADVQYGDAYRPADPLALPEVQGAPGATGTEDTADCGTTP